MGDMVKVYRSRARSDLSNADIKTILQASRRNNEGAGITGMLLLGNGYFVQFIEGTGPAVDRTYRRILSDSRHCDAVLLYDGSGEPRRFGGWPMGFARMEPYAQLASVGEFLRHDHAADPYGFGPDAVLALLLDFRRLCSEGGVTQAA
jgi:hypothetical protein